MLALEQLKQIFAHKLVGSERAREIGWFSEFVGECWHRYRVDWKHVSI